MQSEATAPLTKLPSMFRPKPPSILRNDSLRHTSQGIALSRVILGGTVLLSLLGAEALAYQSPASAVEKAQNQQIDFNRDIRPILSNRCYACHGPDEATVEGGLRLDTPNSAFSTADSGEVAIQPNSPSESEMMRRIRSQDASERMPPAHIGPPLNATEISLLEQWIADGAQYAKHWAFEPLASPPVHWQPISDPSFETWNASPIDRMLWSKLNERGWRPSPTADRRTLLRRVYLDLIGLPPSRSEFDEFEQDESPEAYERRVDSLLASPAFGEHWGRKWLDIARYADSAGYADDPLRTIWGYRDWVIDAINQGMPYDRFTLDQLAGDLLPGATPEQQVATAFHRNTMTNNEGGTNDEEFRNVAVVDRVNTTSAAWLGITMDCAQCHTHKYDPITQEDYFRLFAIFNQSQDADRKDESPVLDWFTPEQRQRQQQLATQSHDIDARLAAPAPHSMPEQIAWTERFRPTIHWQQPLMADIQVESGGSVSMEQANIVSIDSHSPTDGYQLAWQIDSEKELLSLRGLRIETYPSIAANSEQPGSNNSADDTEKKADAKSFSKVPSDNFVLTNVAIEVQSTSQPTLAQFLRVELPGDSKMVSIAEAEVFSGGENLARQGVASQSSTGFEGDASRAIDGNRDGNYAANSVTHTAVSTSPWWELDLRSEVPIDSVTLWNRTDGNLQHRLNGAVVTLLDSERNVVSRETISQATTENELALAKNPKIPLSDAKATYAQDGFPAASAIDGSSTSGWAVGGQHEASHTIEFRVNTGGIATKELTFPLVFRLRIDFKSTHENHTLKELRISTTSDDRYAERNLIPESILRLVELQDDKRSTSEMEELHRYFTSEVSTSNQALRLERIKVEEQIQNIKPHTRVPVMRELEKADRRETFVQLRGNYREHGPRVEPGLPSILHRYEGEASNAPLTRLDLAKWITQSNNPLTPRVIANRYWESLFGIGIVSTSEDFGSQGSLPTHPELLDFLAQELLESGWDTKRLLRSIVLSQAYRQSSQATAEDYEQDPDNAYLSRGPRVRPAAEVIRDTTLAASGLLTHKMHGPSVRPVQPNLGLSAAFGSNTDWETSRGEDRYRRAIYTQWRRSSPYASLATFDAPNRETCILKRDRTNTPLQALVTLNDPNFVEAAQYLARRIVIHEHPDAPLEDQIQIAFGHVLGRTASSTELDAVTSLFAQSKAHLQKNIEQATQLATIPIGPLSPSGEEPLIEQVIDLAAWTALCNVLLNLDEFLVKL